MWLAALVTLFLLINPAPALAVDVAVLQSPESVGDEEFQVTFRTTGADTGTNYFRVDLYQDGTTKYFGETFNGSIWYGGGESEQYFSVTMLSGEISIATVSARLGEPTLQDYPGPGAYKLRIRRYTQSGNSGSADQEPVNISLTKTWPSPEVSPSPSPDPSVPLSPSPSPSAATPGPSLAAAPSTRPKLSPIPSAKLVDDAEGTVAGETIDLSAFGVAPTSPSPVASPQGDSQGLSLNRGRAKIVAAVGSGLILLSAAGIFGFRQWKKKNGMVGDHL